MKLKAFRMMIVSIIALVVLGSLVSCPAGDGGNDNGGDPSAYYYVYQDSWSADIDAANLYFGPGTADPNKFTTSDVKAGKNDPTGNSIKLDFTQLKAGGWNGINTQITPKDLSAYNALTMWVKAETANTQIKEIMLAKSAANIVLKHAGLATLTTTNNNHIVFGSTNWYKIVIPVFNSAFLNGINHPIQIVHDHAAGNLGTFLFDDIRYEKLDTLPTVTSIAYSTNALNVALNKSIDSPAVDITYNDGTNPALITDSKGTQLEWEYVSGDQNIFEITNDYKIKGLLAGTAQIKAKLKGTNHYGAEIGLTVAAPIAFDGVIYDDALKNGFTADTAGDQVKPTISPSDTTKVMAGANAIKLDTNPVTGAWGGGWLEIATGIDASGFTSIQFSVSKVALDALTNPFLQVKIEDNNVPKGEYFVSIYDAGLTTAAGANDFTTYTITLASMGAVDFANFKGIGFWHPKENVADRTNVNGDGGTFVKTIIYIDEVKFIK